MSKSQQTARNVALQALIRVEQNAGYSNIVLNHALDNENLDDRDKSLASAIFYGVLEKRLTLDYYISKCLAAPRKKPDCVALAAIRCGAYQILFMDRIPDSAAVNETVNAVKSVGKSQFSGFVNGVLRGLLRRKGSLYLPNGNGIQALAVKYSVPENLIRFWKKSYGEHVTVQLLKSLAKKPELFIRINKTKCSVEQFIKCIGNSNVKVNTLPPLPFSATLSDCGAPDNLDQFVQGMFHVQDLSAQWVCEVLDPKPGDIVCDCCAAPGGKAFTIAQEVVPNGKVYALDLYENRVNLIKDGAKRLGLINIDARVNDASQGFDDIPLVDKMLCDVPCSGLGVIKKKPEIRYKNLSSLNELPDFQYKILQNASQRVKLGGLLVYSTCTLNPAENSAVAERFLSKNSGFEPMNIKIGIRHSIPEPEYMMTMMPFAGASDGFFVAAFRRKDKIGADS